MNREILVTGGRGLVAQKVIDKLRGDMVLTPSHAEFDITKRDSIETYLDGHPNITNVVHLAAYTDVGEPQTNLKARELCYLVNFEGTSKLFEAINARSPGRVHFVCASTDMIYPGSPDNPGPYDEFSIPINHPLLNHYGRSKLFAEAFVRENYPNSAIVRFGNPVTSEDRKRDDYLSTFVKIYNKNNFLYPVFADQFITLADIDVIALTIKSLVETRKNGIYQVGSEVITPYEIVEIMLRTMGIEYQIERGSVKAYLEKINDHTRYPVLGGLISNVQKKLGIPEPTTMQLIEKLYGKK